VDALADSVIHLLMNGLNPAEKRDGILLAMDAIKEQTTHMRAMLSSAEGPHEGSAEGRAEEGGAVNQKGGTE
jgi:hypothetical protein